MGFVDDSIKNQIIKYIDNIINIPDITWNMFDINIKLKYIHHYCNCIYNNNKNINILTIPLKSIKPKKLIHFCNFTKSINSNLFQEYSKRALQYTFEFRSKYVKLSKRTYYNYNNLPITEYYNIINGYNFLVYSFLKENFDKINIKNLFDYLTKSNSDKLFINNNNQINLIIEYHNNNMIFKFSNNIEITLNLKYSSDMITNNIPLIYQIILTNNI
jgi:hypothetical protein